MKFSIIFLKKKNPFHRIQCDLLWNFHRR